MPSRKNPRRSQPGSADDLPSLPFQEALRRKHDELVQRFRSADSCRIPDVQRFQQGDIAVRCRRQVQSIAGLPERVATQKLLHSTAQSEKKRDGRHQNHRELENVVAIVTKIRKHHELNSIFKQKK